MDVKTTCVIMCLTLAVGVKGIPMKERYILDNAEEQPIPRKEGDPEVLLLTPVDLEQIPEITDDIDSSKSNEVPIVVPAKLSYEPQIYTNTKIMKKHDDAKDQLQDNEEMLVTANNIVFRPLFAYRKSTAQRRRVYSRPSYRRSYGYYYYHPSNPRYYY